LRETLQDKAAACQGSGKVNFIKRMANDELCEITPSFDIFAVHCDYDGIPKTVLEASLAGMPFIINKRKDSPIPEYKDGWVALVENSPAGYAGAIQKLASETERQNLGKKAEKYAHSNWNPQQTESRYANLYKRLMGTRQI